MDLFSLVASLSLDSSQYQKGITQAKGAGQSLASNLEKSFSRIKTAFAAIISIAAVKKVADAAMNLASQTAAAADRIDKQSQALGISRKAFQQWDYILAQSGASIDSLGTSMKTLNSAILGGSDSAVSAFNELGLKLTELQGLSQEDAFGKVVDAFQKMPQGARKSALAVQLLGKQGQSLMPLLNTSSDAMAELRANTERLGFVMSDSMIDAGVKFGDTFDDLKRTFGGLQNILGYALMEPLTNIFQAVTDFFAQESTQTAVEQFAVDLHNLGNLAFEGVQAFFKFLTDHQEDIATIAGNIGEFVGDLITFATENSDLILLILGLVAGFKLMDNPLGLIVAAIVAIAANWPAIKEFFSSTLPNWIHDKIEWVMNVVLPVWEDIKTAITTGWETVIWPAIQEFFKVTFGIDLPEWKDVVPSIKTFWEKTIIPMIDDFLYATFGIRTPDIAATVEKIKDWWNQVVGQYVPILKFKTQNSGPTLSEEVNQESQAFMDSHGISQDTQDLFKTAQGGNFASGLDYVPTNGMPAFLHEGEAILNKRDATAWRTGPNSTISPSALASAVSKALEGMAVIMDGEHVGRLTAQTVSREIERKARAGRFALA